MSEPADNADPGAGFRSLIYDFGRWYEVYLLPTGALVAYERPIALRRPPVLGRDEHELRRNLAARPSLAYPDEDHDQTACPFFACGHAANHWWILPGAPPEFHRTPPRALVCAHHFDILGASWGSPDA